MPDELVQRYGLAPLECFEGDQRVVAGATSGEIPASVRVETLSRAGPSGPGRFQLPPTRVHPLQSAWR
jgi:hypothetical protein